MMARWYWAQVRSDDSSLNGPFRRVKWQARRDLKKWDHVVGERSIRASKPS